jgi:signal transduction histidine kinase
VRAVMSLNWRLPLMISGLLAITLVAFGFLAFTELKQSSVAAAKVQIRTLLATTTESSARVVAQRLVALELSASQPAVIRAVGTGPTAKNAAADRPLPSVIRAVGTRPPAAPAVVDSALRVLRARVVRSDTTSLTGQFLIDASGRRHSVVNATLNSEDLAALDSTVAETGRRDSTTTSAMYLTDSLMRYWVVTPVRSAGVTQGYLAERRQLRGSAAAAKAIKDLTGQDLSLHYAALGRPLWAGLRGEPVAPKFDVNAVADSFDMVAASGEKLIGAKANIRGIPLALVYSINEASVHQRANAFLKRMLMIGAVLLAISMFGAWLVSRRVTRPLKSLTVAARQIARGNYAAREPVQSQDELGELAQTFNRMAERIGESHAELAFRIEESEALASQLHQASKAKSEFLAMMSHELRTPLSAIAGYAEILQLGMRGKLNEAQQLDLSRIQANQVHLLRIINDILDLAQVESGQMQVSAAPVPMHDVLTDVEPIVLPLFAGRGINYTVDAQLKSFVVLAERDRLAQVLVNLIANAVRFTETGGSIAVHGELQDGRVHVHVTDTGIGIAKDKHDAIFQPFVQADSGASRRAQGTGLGLAISRRIAEAMGGTLTVKSTVGQGSTFTLELESACPQSQKVVAQEDTGMTTAAAPAERRTHAMS